MQIGEDPGTLYKVFYWIHKIITSWYISEIILFVMIFSFLLLFFIILRNWRVYTFLIFDRVKFVKQYFYYSGAQKKHFVKSFMYIIKNEIKKYLLIIGIILVLAIIAFYILFGVIPDIRPQPSALN